MKLLRRILTNVTMVALLLGLTAPLAAVPVYANTTQDEACQAIGSGTDCSGTDTTTGKTSGDLTSIVKTIVNILSVVVGVLAVVMIIVGGLKYITSGGDSNKTKSAKDTILHALIGLVIVAMAQFIVKFVLTTATNATVSCSAGQHVSAGKCVADKKS